MIIQPLRLPIIPYRYGYYYSLQCKRLILSDLEFSIVEFSFVSGITNKLTHQLLTKNTMHNMPMHICQSNISTTKPEGLLHVVDAH